MGIIVKIKRIVDLDKGLVELEDEYEIKEKHGRNKKIQSKQQFKSKS